MTASDDELIAELEKMFHGRFGYFYRLNAPHAEGLLFVARKGKNYWNAWRLRYPSAVIDLSASTQEQLCGIDFSGFRFPSVENSPCVDFSRTNFLSENKFEGAIFGDNAIFENSSFESANFQKAIFGNNAKFGGAKYTGKANFKEANFSDFANFRAANFSEKADFNRCEFGSQANFEHTIFSGHAAFIDCSFGSLSSFLRTKFLQGADLKGSSFGDALQFSPETVSGNINFNCINHEKRTSFNGSSRFSGQQFGEEVDFGGSLFMGGTFFSTPNFGRNAKFEKADFREKTEFKSTNFSRIEFIDTTFHQDLSFQDALFEGESFFLRTVFRGKVEFKGRRQGGANAPVFHEIRFLGCWFYKDAVFRGHEFKTTALFGKTPPGQGRNLDEIANLLGIRAKRHLAEKTVFLGIPDFHGCKFHQDTSFVGTEFEVPPGNDAARAFRTLKLAMEGLKSSHEEQMFFRLEMHADRPDLPRGRQWISRLYWASSNYGHSLLHPFLTLIGFMLLFGATHGLLTNLHYVVDLPPNLSEFDSARTWQWFRYVLINTFPVPGFDKVQMDLRIALFGQDGYLAAIATTLEMLHKVISLGCIFLLGLALRNLFKMKS